MTDPTAARPGLPGTLETLHALALRRARLPATGPAAERARQLVDHVETYLLPRAMSLDAPLLVLIVGPTGSGKSTLTNALVGARVSETGVLRPTTRDAIVSAERSDFERLRSSGVLGRLPLDRLRLVETGRPRPGVVVIDAPDVDSVELDNRALADRLVESADLAIFVTTATRYADRVPWDVLERVAARGLPLVVVINRLPRSGADAVDEAAADLVTADLRRLMSEAGLGGSAVGGGAGAAGGASKSGDATEGGGAPKSRDATEGSGGRGGFGVAAAGPEIVGVPEGALDPTIDGLSAGAIGPVLRLLAGLEADREARRELAERALRGALAGIGPLIHDVADDLDHEAIDDDALHRTADASYRAELGALMDELGSGTFLREEVLGRWHTFVGADQVTRLFATGIGRIQGTVLALLRGTPPAPVTAVSEATTSDLAALARSHAAEAARRTAQRWSATPEGARLVDADPALWTAGTALGGDLDARLDAWLESIAASVREAGAQKRTLARGAAVGVNAAGVAVMLAVFAHTGGLTGAEMGVAAGTAFLNQKLLYALFGEAAVIRLIDDARRRLESILGAAFDRDRTRFAELVPSGDDLRSLAAELRTVAGGVEDSAPAAMLGRSGP